jgi:hypothetical protein
LPFRCFFFAVLCAFASWRELPLLSRLNHKLQIGIAETTIKHMTHPVLESAARSLGVPLVTRGDLTLLDRPRRALLISRTPRQPTPTTPWVRSTLAATAASAALGEVLVTGAGRTPFDLALLQAMRLQSGAIVALATAAAASELPCGLLPDAHLLVWPEQPTPKTQAPARRDLLMGALADRAHCIQVRKNGNMAAVRAAMQARGCDISTRFQCADNEAFPAEKTPPCTEFAPPEDSWLRLTHFTREPDGAWPGEECCAYLGWLAGGENSPPRDGFGALCRILEQRRIRASGFLMPDSARMVCFTAHPPAQALTLRRWRRGLRRWTFAPYGLAMPKLLLQELGAKPVLYASEAAIKAAPKTARRWMQVDQAGAGLRWSGEAEWRVAEDVDLAAVNAASLLALVTHPAQAAEIKRRFGIAARVL